MLAALSTLSACKKEDMRTKEELLQATHWKTEEVQTVDVTAGGTPVVTTTQVACSSGCSCDDYIAFLPGHQLDRNDGAILCSSPSNAGRGNWYIDEKDQTLIASNLIGRHGYYAFAIEELTAKRLRVSRQLVQGTNVSTYRVTFSAQ